MSNIYYCKGNLKHNGVFYRRGDAVELEESVANPLIKGKVVQTQPIPEEDLGDVAPVPQGEQGADETAKPAAGGDKPTETGEPSLDGGGQNETQQKGGILGQIFGNKDKDISEGL